MQQFNWNDKQKAESNTQAVEVADKLSRLCNTYSSEGLKDVLALMANDHRTIQQTFTKFCFLWIEHCATMQNFDGRNKAAHDVSEQMIQGFRELQVKNGFDGSTLDLMSTPSQWMQLI